VPLSAGIIDGMKKQRGAVSKEMKEEQECAEKVGLQWCIRVMTCYLYCV
jgi:hypothetical protein